MPYTEEQKKEADRQYRIRNRDKIREYRRQYARKYRKLYPEKEQKRNRDYRLKNLHRIPGLKKRLSEDLKEAMFTLLGDCCVRCGFNDRRALQIDHVKGGGNREDKLRGDPLMRKVMRSHAAKENKYQILCANCNWIKRVENKELRRG